MEDLTPLYNKEFYLAYLCGENVVLPIPDGNTEHYLAYLCGMDVPIPEPLYTKEFYLAYKCGMDVELPEPGPYRIDQYLAKWCGMDVEVPEPMYRIEYWLAQLANSGELKTVTGNPITVSDALAKPAESLVIEILPRQDLHGYDNPWPAGGGKNLCPDNWVQGQIQANGTLSSSIQNCISTPFFWLNAGTYTVSRTYTDVGAGQFAYHLYDAEKVHISDSGWIANPTTFTLTEGRYVRLTSRKSYSGANITPSIVGTSFFPMIELGSFATAYEPYENICPITGHSEASAYHGKVSILDGVTMHTGYFNDSGTPVASANTMRTEDYIPVTAGEKVAIRFATTNTGNRLRAHEYDSSKTWLRQSYSQVISDMDMRTVVLTISNDASFIRFSLPNYSSLDAFNDVDTYTIQLGQTVYGGSLDVTTGVMTVERVGVTVGESGWSYYSPYLCRTFNDKATPPGIGSTNYPLICSMLPYDGVKYASQFSDVTVAQSTNKNIYIKDTSCTSEAEYYAKYKDAVIVYYLATPLTYQLTSTEIQMLLGNNVLWNDVDGDMTLEYLADGPADDVDALQILLNNRYVNNGEPDEATDKEALEILLGGNTR